jgi:hypothetical protein
MRPRVRDGKPVLRCERATSVVSIADLGRNPEVIIKSAERWARGRIKRRGGLPASPSDLAQLYVSATRIEEITNLNAEVSREQIAEVERSPS